MSLRRIYPQVTDFSLSGRSRPDQPTGFSRLVIESGEVVDAMQPKNYVDLLPDILRF